MSPVILRNIYVKIRKDSVKNQDNLYSEICHFTKCFRSYTIFHTVNVINKSRMIFHLWKTYLHDFIKVKHIAMYFYDCVTNKFILYVLTKYLKINETMCSTLFYHTEPSLRNKTPSEKCNFISLCNIENNVKLSRKQFTVNVQFF